MPFQIIRADITKVKADAIVNSANPQPMIGGGCDSAIYRAAGSEQLLEERKKIGVIATGEAAVTPAFSLGAKYIIHTVGPVWNGGQSGEFLSLASSYRNSLKLAEELGCESIAFPLISSGVYGFPKDRALQVALDEFDTFLERSEMEITLVVFDRRAYELSGEHVLAVAQYIDDASVKMAEESEYRSYQRRPSAAWPAPAAMRPEPEDMAEAPMYGMPASKSESEKASKRQRFKGITKKPKAVAKEDRISFDSEIVYNASLSDIIRQRDESFQQRLFRMIDERGLADSEVYKKANLDRKLFSKIRCNEDYSPKKRTALAFAIALELSLDETTDLLRSAGYALSESNVLDLVVRYCIENRIYNIIEINSLLFKYDQPLLGS